MPPSPLSQSPAMVTDLDWVDGLLIATVEVSRVPPARLVLCFQVRPDLEIVPLGEVGFSDQEAARAAFHCLEANLAPHRWAVEALFASA
jgi:hypothetical protein